jgi:hypothetical protein
MTTPNLGNDLPRRAGRVCVALPARGHAYDEMASVLAVVVRELGSDVFLARDGDPAILEADVTILFGRCVALDASAKLLAEHSSRRPATVLWHVELLPPSVIPAHAEEAARKLVRCDVSRLPKRRQTLVRCIPHHSALVNLVRRIRCTQLIRRCGWDGELGDGRLHPREWHHAVQNALWFKECHSDVWCDCLAVSTVPRHRLLTEMGIPCEYAPLGYHALWGTDRGGNRDIDVVFLGNVKRTGRERFLSQVTKQLARAGVNLLIVDRDCYGEDRIKLLNRAKISLDLVKNKWEMPVLRLVISMACGALVVSNCSVDPYPFREEHLVRVDSGALASSLLEHLRDEPLRRQKVEGARRHLTTELAWHPVVSRVLHRALAQHRTCTGVPS